MRRFLFFLFYFVLFSLFCSIPKTYAAGVFGGGYNPYPTADGCKCEKPNVSGVAQNGFMCNFKGEQKHGWCSDQQDACLDGNPGDSVTVKNSNPQSWELPNLTQASGVQCSKPLPAWTNCKCLNSNVPGSAVNRFDCDGGKSDYCDNNQACINAPGAAYNTGSGQVAQGIRCDNAQATACVCDPNQIASVAKNGFTCDYNGAKKHAWCNDPGLVCSQSTTKTVTVDNVQTGPNDIPNNVVAHGVQCAGPTSSSQVLLPPPPAAPCVQHGTNGTCTVILTSLGNVATDPAGFISKLFGILLAVGGATALLLIMRAGYRIMTARGNAEGLKEGREQIVAAIIGLMFIIFSFVLLQVIGVDLLRLPTT